MIKNTLALSGVEFDEEDPILDSENPKILLLGACDSGKTTLMHRVLGGNVKQITLQHIQNYILAHVKKVCEKCISTESISSRLHHDYLSSCRTIVESAPKKNLDESSPTSSKTHAFPASFQKTTIFTSKLGNTIVDLWTNCMVFKEVYEKYRDELHVSDSCEYFLNPSVMDRLCKVETIPNLEEVLHIRTETKGVDIRKVYYSETEGFPKLQTATMDEKFFKQYPNCISVFDVGGNSRKKWKGYFHNISLGVFLVNLSSFAKKSKDAPEKNELIDSLELFEEMINHESFTNVPILLLFNKYERFCQLIEKGIDLDLAFPEYKNRGQTCKERIEQSMSFVKVKFESKVWAKKENLHCRFVTLLSVHDSNQVLLDMLMLSKLLKEDSASSSSSLDKRKNCLIM